MIAQLPMLREILEIERRSKSGLEDIDHIPGIERLWMARMHFGHQRFFKSASRFFERLDKQVQQTAAGP